ncbi:MAG: hypothetical protein MK086_14270 [Flavobacteriales bacterium]|nr:hypothetical protein [Flavobacteriales bacterium]
MFKPTIRQVQAVLSAKNYKFFDEGEKPYNLNIIGIRSTSKLMDFFNETLVVIYRDELKEMHIDYFHYTTKPGLHYLKNPLHPNGCAVLKEGQHLGSMIKRKHRGKYYALCQAKSMPYYRDNDRDEELEFTGKVYTGKIGLNIHRESPTKIDLKVGRNSAGCGVIQARFDYFMWLIDMGIKYWKNQFTYTLINEGDIMSHLLGD